MEQPTSMGARPWHRHYAPGVSCDFVPPRTTWTEMMSAAFDAHADRVLIEYYGQSLTYAEMRAQAARVAAALQARGIRRGDRVALHLPNCPWHPIFFFGAIAAGAVVTHLSPLDADREIAFKLRESGARLVVSLTTPELCRHFEPLLAQGGLPDLVLCPDPVSGAGRDCPVLAGASPVDTFWAGQEGAAYAPVAVTPEDLALLQFTGGTTGLPKAAMLSHANLAAAVYMYHEAMKDASML